MTDSTLPMPHSELDDFFGPRKWDVPPTNPPPDKLLGVVVGGSLSKGLEVKLDRDTSTEETAVGRYVVVQGQSRRFFSMITDVMLDATDPRWAKIAPDMSDDFMREVMIGTNTFGLLHVSPMLMLEEGATETEARQDRARPLRARGRGHRRGREPNLRRRDSPGYFYVGEPLDMDGIRIYLNLKRFVERSSGVFGKSGTGKTFLTRMLLAGIIKENVAVNLVFDMHNEYGWKSQDEAKTEVKGLRQLFPSGKVAVVTLDPESSRRRGSKVDYDVTIGYDQLEPEDVEMLQAIDGPERCAGRRAVRDSSPPGPQLDRAPARRRASRRDAGHDRCRADSRRHARRDSTQVEHVPALRFPAALCAGQRRGEIAGLHQSGRQRRAGVRPLRRIAGSVHPRRQLPHAPHPSSLRRAQGSGAGRRAR